MHDFGDDAAGRWEVRMRVLVVLLLSLVGFGCPNRQNVPCNANGNCDLASGGTCVAGPSESWCAYPDPNCPSGYRFSDLDVGDGVSGQCVGQVQIDAGGDGASGDAASGTWGAPAPLANVNSTGEDLRPAISANGLELYLVRGNLNPPYGEIFAATRTSTTQSFGSPTAVTAVNGSAENENGVVPASSGLELFVSRAGEILISTRSTPSAAWGTPTTTGMTATYFSLSADDLTMYLIKRCPMGQHNGEGPCLFRSDRTAVGASWSQLAFFAWPPGGLQWNSAHISGDGLHLLLSSPYSGSAVRAAQSHRANMNDPWGPLKIIDALSLESTNAEMRWNATRNEIYLTAKPVVPPVGGSDIFISVLQ
ncbi:MAG: hypothetical protein M3680_13095 [Myxococcota bacterium]|nr:hypothetical protein [Myxococcota bacterium]